MLCDDYTGMTMSTSAHQFAVIIARTLGKRELELGIKGYRFIRIKTFGW